MGVKSEKTIKIMNFKQKKWLKPFFHLSTELNSKTENNFLEKIQKSLNNVLSAKIEEDLKKRLVSTRPVKECVEVQSNITYKPFLKEMNQKMLEAIQVLYIL